MPRRSALGIDVNAWGRAAGVAVIALACATPALARAEGERLMLGVEAAYLSPTQRLSASPYAPGGTISIAAELSLTPWLIPLARVRAAMMGDPTNGVDAQGSLGSLGSLLAGVRFRPRGIAHPEETPRATCVWAEIDAGVALWNGRAQPTFEAAVGLSFEAGDVDLGPVYRFVHVMPTSTADGAAAFSMTVGIEIIVGDARSP